jgi:hypothetical protein
MDKINPSHYKLSGMEVFDVIRAILDRLPITPTAGYCLGNTIKYISRAGVKDKNLTEDLKKAEWYLNRAIELTDENR